MAIFDKVKHALRISADDDALNEEILDLIKAAVIDLGIAGVVVPEETAPLEDEDSDPIEDEELAPITTVSPRLDAIVTKAVITYCKMSFGLPEDYERLKRSYDEQKAQLSNATGYTDWEVVKNV